MKYRDANPSFETIKKYIDYVIELISNEDGKKYYPGLITGVHEGIFSQYVNSKISPDQGFFPAIALAEVVLCLIVIYREGFIIDKNLGLLDEEHLLMSKPDENLLRSVFGLNQNVQTSKLKNNVFTNYFKFKNKGGFVFDVDLTMLPKEAEFLTSYPELAYLIMQLLRDQYKVGIISGNSAEEQIPRIVEAISREMKGDKSGLKNLIFYVDGGATKIYFDESGRPINNPDNIFLSSKYRSPVTPCFAAKIIQLVRLFKK